MEIKEHRWVMDNDSDFRQDRGMISRLRELAIRGLARMYLPEERCFVFRFQRHDERILPQGVSRRYTAISLIGLAGEKSDVVRAVLAGQDLHAVCDRLRQDMARMSNLGDVALSLWAACAAGYPGRKAIRERLLHLRPLEAVHPVVELSWTLVALCMDRETAPELRHRLALRLQSSFNPASGVFPHMVGLNGSGLRSHVSCFADMVYPIHALSTYYTISGNRAVLNSAAQCAEQICRLQGPFGQWWWHYDLRTGQIVERYPVYAVHQDAMAPMALFALKDAGGPDFSGEVRKGLDWLANSPEIGSSLIDWGADLVWRKVARREPRKFSRSLQTLASWLHPSLRFPALDQAFPPKAVDYEDRPYHLGWVLSAWPEERAVLWESMENAQ